MEINKLIIYIKEKFDYLFDPEKILKKGMMENRIILILIKM